MHLLKLLLPFLLGLAAVSALAGQKNSNSVVVNTASKNAWGQVTTARDSASTKEQISCWTDGGTESECYAATAQGTIGRCRAANSMYHKVIQMVNSTSHIYFEWVPNLGVNVCTRIIVDNNSYHLR